MRSIVTRVSAEGGALTAITKLDASRHDRVHVVPSPLPDGRHFLFLALSNEPAKSGVFVGSLDSMDTKWVMAGDSQVDYIEPGYLMFLRDTVLMAQRFESYTLTLSGSRSESLMKS